jgi:hypothetical protein
VPTLAAQLADAGVPLPRPLPHRAVAGGTLTAGAPITNGGVTSVILPIAGAVKVRLRGLATAGGTIVCAFLRPNGLAAYGASNPANITVVGATEFVSTIDVVGESLLRLTFTGSASGAWTFLDVMTQ